MDWVHRINTGQSKPAPSYLVNLRRFEHAAAASTKVVGRCAAS
jgi:hypothetical protein